MCKHWSLHISTDTDHLGAVLGSFWAVWRGLLWCLKAKLRSWRFPRYWWFNKRYYSGYQLICLISWPLLIASRCWIVSIERSIQGLSVAIETVRIDGDMAEWSLWHLPIKDDVSSSSLLSRIFFLVSYPSLWYCFVKGPSLVTCQVVSKPHSMPSISESRPRAHLSKYNWSDAISA